MKFTSKWIELDNNHPGWHNWDPERKVWNVFACLCVYTVNLVRGEATKICMSHLYSKSDYLL